MDKERIERYSRQMLVPGMGVEGQRALAAATVAVVGLDRLVLMRREASRARAVRDM